MEWARLAARAGAMIMRPGRTWREIAPEPGDARTVLVGYVAPLAAIPAVCGALGMLAFGIRFGEVGLRPSFLSILMEMASGYVLSLVCIWLAALWTAALAPAFGGLAERDQALKLVAYASTAIWLAGAANLYPNLALPVSLLAGLYAAWSLMLGLQPMMRSNITQRLTYFAAVLLGVLVLTVLRAAAVARAAELGGPLMLR